MEHPIQMDDLRVHPFIETSMFGLDDPGLSMIILFCMW